MFVGALFVAAFEAPFGWLMRVCVAGTSCPIFTILRYSLRNARAASAAWDPMGVCTLGNFCTWVILPALIFLEPCRAFEPFAFCVLLLLFA